MTALEGIELRRTDARPLGKGGEIQPCLLASVAKALSKLSKACHGR
jgi:hypothetical protein